MDFVQFAAVAQECAPAVHPKTMLYLSRGESSLNEFAIGVVGGRLAKQPRNIGEAVATARYLMAQGINFSAGAVQVNVHNWKRLGLDEISVFNPCHNLRAGAAILADCFNRAEKSKKEGQQASLKYALSCYYSNDFTTGFRAGYVNTIVQYASKQNK